MGAIGIPFDAMNANVGSIKSNGGSEIATKAEIEQNLQDLADGKAVVTGGDVLQGHLTFNASSEIAFDSVADSQTTINELEAELKESQESIAESEQQIARLEKKPSLTEEEQYTLENHKKSGTYPGVRKTNIIPTAIPRAQITAMAESSLIR